LTEVQPVLDKHCVRCHDYSGPAGERLNLAGDQTLFFNASYTELWRQKLTGAVGAGPSDTQKAYAWGSHSSKLVKTLLKKHSGVKLSPEEFDRIVTWVDINAPYYPTYASAYQQNLAGRSPLNPDEIERLSTLTGVPLKNFASFGGNPGPQISFQRPKKSPCLAKIAKKRSPEYREALALIEAGAARLKKNPRADMDGFVLQGDDAVREDKYVARAAAESKLREALREGEQAYDE
ncbi:MAG: hypothetical protein GY851_31620, partial [bacterium]|nr:hypothetical protein [bacterium]